MVSTLGSVYIGTERTLFLIFLDLGSRKLNMKLPDLFPTVQWEHWKIFSRKPWKYRNGGVSIFCWLFLFGVVELGIQSRWNFSRPYEATVGSEVDVLSRIFFSTLAVLEVILLRVCGCLIVSMEYNEAWSNTCNNTNEKRNYGGRNSKMALHSVWPFLLSREYRRDNSTNQNCLNAGPPPPLPGMRSQWSIIASKACKISLRTPLSRCLIEPRVEALVLCAQRTTKNLSEDLASLTYLAQGLAVLSVCKGFEALVLCSRRVEQSLLKTCVYFNGEAVTWSP